MKSLEKKCKKNKGEIGASDKYIVLVEFTLCIGNDIKEFILIIQIKFKCSTNKSV